MQNQKLPIKTKIVAWWMVVIGGIMGSIVAFIFIKSSKSTMGGGEVALFLLGIMAFFIFLIFFIPGILLIITKKKLAWWIVRISLWIGITGIIGTRIIIMGLSWTISDIIITIITLIIIGIPLFLLEGDRKNFF